MSKLKNNRRSEKISQREVRFRSCLFINENSDVLLLSFRYMTANNRYNFDWVKKNNLSTKDKVSLYESLNATLKDLTENGWISLINKRRESGGSELISLSEIRFKPKDSLGLSEDSKIRVIRFGPGNKYRILGYKGSNCKAVYYIIGFDFDYSAYNH